MTFATVSVDVDVSLGHIDTDDLINELESRNEFGNRDEYEDRNELMFKIYGKICLKQNYDEEIRQYIWLSIGKMV